MAHTYICGIYAHTAVAIRLKQIGFSRKRNDKAEARVYGAYGRNFVPRIPLDRSRKVVLRFDIGGIYWYRNISISVGSLGLTGFGNLDRPYLVLLSGHQLTAAAALRCCSREKNTQ